jgi:hypothetical protein
MNESEVARQNGKTELQQQIQVQQQIQEFWNDAVRTVIRRAKGLPDDAAVVLPEGGTGKYVRYALDSNGRLSLGRRHGRLLPHWNKKRLAIKSMSLEIFKREVAVMLDALKQDAAEKGVPFTGLTDDMLGLVGVRATTLTTRYFAGNRRAAAKATNARQDVSRRINHGLQAGNEDRRAHAA